MRNVPALALREMNSLFFSPLIYTLLTALLIFAAFFFCAVVAEHGEATITVGALTRLLNFFFLVGTPMLTMRLLSEEYRSGNIECLMTAPVTDGEVVIAKFLGALVLYVCLLAPTLLFHFILEWLGSPDWGIVISAYVGLTLMGFQFVALGVFCSALTRNQIVAAMLALVLQLSLWLLGPVGESIPGHLGDLARYAGAVEHLNPFMEGRIAFRDVAYFLTLGCFWLFLAVRALESKRWR